MRIVTILRRHSILDLAMFARAVALLVMVRAALLALPYRWVERGMRPKGDQDDGAPVANERRRATTIWAVDAAARRVLGSKPCLTQALVARWLLSRYGIYTELRIGVAKDHDGTLLAHAWLEREGGVVIGGYRSPARYRMFEPV